MLTYSTRVTPVQRRVVSTYLATGRDLAQRVRQPIDFFFLTSFDFADYDVAFARAYGDVRTGCVLYGTPLRKILVKAMKKRVQKVQRRKKKSHVRTTFLCGHFLRRPLGKQLREKRKRRYKQWFAH